MATPTTHQDDQLLRRMFDTLYRVDIRDIKKLWTRLSRGQKWLVITAIACVTFVWLSFQFIQVAADMIAESNAPTVNEVLAAPYELTLSPVVLDSAALPNFVGYTQTPLELETLNPVIACMAGWDGCATVDDELARIPLSSGSASEYVNEAGTDVIRINALVYADAAAAREAMFQLYDYRRSVSNIGDYVLMSSQPVAYFFSSWNGWVHLTWTNGNSVYTVTADSYSDLENTVNVLRAAPPVIEGVTSG